MNSTNNKNNTNKQKTLSKKTINNKPYALSMKDIQQNEVNYITNKALELIGTNKIVSALNPTFSSSAIHKNKKTTNKSLANVGGKRKNKSTNKKRKRQL